jgi:hypothetical protein
MHNFTLLTPDVINIFDDTYNLGALLHYILTGYMPLHNPVSQTMQTDFQKLIEKNITPQSCALIAALMTNKPDQRMTIRSALHLATFVLTKTATCVPFTIDSVFKPDSILNGSITAFITAFNDASAVAISYASSAASTSASAAFATSGSATFASATSAAFSTSSVFAASSAFSASSALIASAASTASTAFAASTASAASTFAPSYASTASAAFAASGSSAENAIVVEDDDEDDAMAVDENEDEDNAMAVDTLVETPVDIAVAALLLLHQQ